MRELCFIFRNEFKKYGYKIPTTEFPRAAVKLVAIFRSELRLGLPMIGQFIAGNNKKSRELLGIKYDRNIEQTIIEMGYSVIDHGFVPDRTKG